MSRMNLHQSQSHEVLRSWQSQRTDVNHHKDFVLPLFVGNDDEAVEAIESMPGVYRYGSNRALEYLDPLVNKFGLRAVLLFPVITKSDQAKFDNEIDSDVRDVSSPSPSSSIAAETNSSSPSSSTDDDDDDDDDEPTEQMCVLPERLLPEDECEDQDTAAAGANSQNPFLNQNEEEEDHLLVEDDRPEKSDHSMVVGGDIKKNALITGGKKSSTSRQVTRRNLITRSLDVKLIKGLALRDENNPVLRLIPRLRAKFAELLIICDVCLCTFTSTGHCCLFEHTPIGANQAPLHLQSRRGASINQSSMLNQISPLVGAHTTTTSIATSTAAPLTTAGNQMASKRFGVASLQYPIDNKISCQYLAKLALEYAIRGCNVVAPSDMMDGRIQTIREKLNENQLHHVSILSYSAKFASSFYGPFRQATLNSPEFGDRTAYQLPPGSRAMAMKAVQRDIEQGADFVMVKPGGPYLDIVRDLREAHPNVPIAVYQVSGEYSMLKIAANANILDLRLALNEMLTAYRRAGATIIISYFTPEILRGEL